MNSDFCLLVTYDLAPILWCSQNYFWHLFYSLCVYGLCIVLHMNVSACGDQRGCQMSWRCRQLGAAWCVSSGIAVRVLNSVIASPQSEFSSPYPDRIRSNLQEAGASFRVWTWDQQADGCLKSASHTWDCANASGAVKRHSPGQRFILSTFLVVYYAYQEMQMTSLT